MYYLHSLEHHAQGTLLHHHPLTIVAHLSRLHVHASLHRAKLGLSTSFALLCCPRCLLMSFDLS